MTHPNGGLARPNVSAPDAVRIAKECYGLEVRATELGSNQDRNYLLTDHLGERTVLRIDNPIFTDEERDGQHEALRAYRAHGVPAAEVLPGLNGELTQHSHGYAVRLSKFATGEPMVTLGYLAPSVLASFGELAGASVRALKHLAHPGLDRNNMWDMRVAAEETRRLSAAIGDAELRARVLSAVAAAELALRPVQAALPVQVIHGDLTDDNVMGRQRADSRVYPHTVLDLGDLGRGWRVAELAVMLTSLLHHDHAHPLRVLETVAAYHRIEPLTVSEQCALWPLVVLRSALLVASGWNQLSIDTDNDYAKDRISGEQRMFDSATSVPVLLATESIHALLGEPQVDASETVFPFRVELSDILPAATQPAAIAHAGIESESLAGGEWLREDAETRLLTAAFANGATVSTLPYGVFRLTRTVTDSPDVGSTWPLGAEFALDSGVDAHLTAPLACEVVACTTDSVSLALSNEWVLRVSGVRLHETVRVGARLMAGDPLGSVNGADWAADHRVFGVTLVRSRALSVLPATAPQATVALCEPQFVAAWQRLTVDPAVLLGQPSLMQWDTAPGEQARREEIFASAQERYYERPMQVERGWRHFLVDVTGRSYIDMVNNVTGVGHGHPGVADAVNRQIRLLNTNSRFLYRGLAEYSERLLALMPAGSGLDTVLLVNSGSEAVDLALRLAQAATGRKTVVALREAYHGWTMASDAVTTSAYDNPFALENRPEWVHIADVPNTYRGSYRGSDAAQRYLADFAADLTRLDASGTPVAGFICESVLGNAGGVLLPDGYLRGAYELVREHGGVCIADEVQVGFGRMGSSFWGFEQSQVVPDIVTIAKPMGNGFPIGGVVTSKRIADALASQGQFFSSAGGNPLSCVVGVAVLDAMESEQLQQNAQEVGEFLAAGFRELASRHSLIGHVHGEGLYLGVELVRDRVTREPAASEAAAICERMRELGVVVLTTSERSNVLKVKPPLTLSRGSASAVLRALDTVLSSGW